MGWAMWRCPGGLQFEALLCIDVHLQRSIAEAKGCLVWHSHSVAAVTVCCSNCAGVRGIFTSCMVQLDGGAVALAAAAALLGCSTAVVVTGQVFSDAGVLRR